MDTAIKWAWAAGLFEGEGSAYIAGQISSKGKRYNYTRLELKMTDKDVVEKFHSIVKYGRIRYHDPPSLKPNWKPSWSWYCTNKEECRQIIDNLWPHLGKRRRDKIIELDL